MEDSVRVQRFSRRHFLSVSSAALLGVATGCRASDTRMSCGDALSTPLTRSAVESKFDLIVVGSGFAGSFLGLRAVENQFSTLIIEAGGDTPGHGPIAGSFQVESAGAIRYRVQGTRVIAVGGTSNRWGGVVSRPFPNDFRMRSEYGMLSDWPISYADVEDYLCQSESLLQVRGAPLVPGEPPRQCPYPEQVVVSLPALEFGDDTPAYVPVARSRETESDALRLQRNVIPSYEDSRYSTLRTGEQVTRLVTLDGARIDHVETRRSDGSVGRYGARWFVVAAGPIESPRLLLQSRSSQYPDGLGNTNGIVGRYLSMHPSFETSFVPDAMGDVEVGEFRSFEAVETLRREGIGGYHVHLVTRDDGRISLRVQPEMESRRDNHLSLSSDWCDQANRALPELTVSFSDRDLRTFERIREFIGETKMSLAARIDTVRDWERWRAHPSGTCRMGFGPESGVVNRNNRVFGLENLYISGASTFTTAGTANPTNLVVALTLRLADHLIAERDRLEA